MGRWPCLLSSHPPEINEAQEYQLKAVLLERFCAFTNWPEETGVNDPSRPFVIAVIGKNPFLNKFTSSKIPKDWLLHLYQKKTIKGKKVEVRHISTPEEIPGCNLLFIARTNKSKLESILAVAKQNAILTIADSPGFAKRGVHINFYYAKGRKLKFEANETELKGSGLDASFHLLKLAKIINPIYKRRNK